MIVQHQKIAARVFVCTVVVCAFVLGYLLGNQNRKPVEVTVAPVSDSGQRVALQDLPDGQIQSAEPACINLNLADQSQLENLPGIGPELASRIIAYRESIGQFIAKEQIMAVSGIGEKRYAELEPLITVEVTYEDSGCG